MKTVIDKSLKAHVHCPICTHTVEADVESVGRRTRVIAGQKCHRCSASLDAAIVLQVLEAV